MKGPAGRSYLLVFLASVLLLGGVAATNPAAQAPRPRTFSEAEIFFELNDTDGDLGIHSSAGGGCARRA
jgi:hypothetical protein